MSAATRRTFLKTSAVSAAAAALPAWRAGAGGPAPAPSQARPNIVLLMTDDQGWGQTGYNGHPLLKTPNLDAMAANGLRFDRFYAASPVCSPTRASVLTGRSPDRTGVFSHGFALRLQERTLPAALQAAGYATGHFGKWHLNGLKGPGVPILGDDAHSPGAFGFDEWLSVTNYFDRNPVMSRKGIFVEFKGDPSEIIVGEALAFVRTQAAARKPFFAVIWTGSPHSPFDASEEDARPFGSIPPASREHHGEIAAFDRSVGALRQGLRDLGLADNTLVWYCSDNGGLPSITPPSTGGLRGFKGSVYEGGLRVPAVVEWPSVIRPRRTSHPASTLDIFPTLADVLGLSEEAPLKPLDGASLKPLFRDELGRRQKPIPFRFQGKGAWLDAPFKLVAADIEKQTFELYDLAADPAEANDLSDTQPERLARMRRDFLAWSASVDNSVNGLDYAERSVRAGHPSPRGWDEDPRYAPHVDAFRRRPEYRPFLKPRRNGRADRP